MANGGTTTYPGTIDTFNNPSGGTTYEDDAGFGHENLHAQVHDAIESVETVLGTTGGTSVLKHFAAGQFPIRSTGGDATGTVVQNLVGGTFNNNTFGSPTMVGGTATNLNLVTPILPTGMPLQFAPMAVTTATGTTINTGTVTFLFQGTITPIRSDSQVYALGVANGIDNIGGGRVTVELRQNTTSGGTSGTVVASANVGQNSTGVDGESSCFVMGTFAPGNTTVRYVKMTFQKQDTGGTPSSYINRFSEQSSILLVEVK